jgi:hypothetical protein
MNVSETGTSPTRWALKVIPDKVPLGRALGHKLATTSDLRPQRIHDVKRCSIVVSSFASLVFQRQPSATPAPRGVWKSKFES